jgi:hypothetical protein
MHMKSKLLILSALIIVGATSAACKKTVVSNGGSGGTGTTGVTSSTGTKSTTNTTGTGTKTTTTGGTQATTTTGGGMTCDSIGVCQVQGNMSPTGDCVACSLNMAAGYTDSGSCTASYIAAYGMDGKCTGGGQQAACDELTCENKCDPTGMFSTKTQLDCLCTNDGQKCLPAAMQTNTATCLGALHAVPAAETAVDTLDTCILQQVCPTSCANAG